VGNSAQNRVYKNTNEVKFGHVEGPGHGQEMPMTGGVYFARRGGKFVTIGGTGNATPLASTGNSVFGWAEVETKDSAATYPAILTTAGDRAFVIYADDRNVFELPVIKEIDASLGASIIGRGCGVDYDGTTYGQKQGAVIYGSGASPLLIVDYNVDKRTVLVRKRSVPTQYM